MLSSLSIKREYEKGLGYRPYINECMIIDGVRSEIVIVVVVSLFRKC